MEITKIRESNEKMKTAESKYTLREVKIGETAEILTVGGDGALRQHFLDMGMIPGEKVTVVKYAPMGDPVEIRIHGYELTLRLDDADKIAVTKPYKAETAADNTKKKLHKHSPHPSFGEVISDKDNEKAAAFPSDHVYTFALVGNQNCGKTTLFNRLTGANQHVGNFPGVTVDRKDGEILKHSNTSITDLPGIYSMSPYSSEELVSRDFVLDNRPDGIINIVDSTNIERNLYLTMQLIEMDRPMVVALNMMDELTGNGGSVDVNTMEKMLGVPVVPISAAKNKGIEELVSHALNVAKYQELPKEQDFCSKDENGGAIHRCIHAIAHTIEDNAERAKIPIKFAV